MDFGNLLLRSSVSGGDLAMEHTAPVLLPVAELFTTSSKQFSRFHPLQD
jgi:hypothetical protein